MEGLTGVLRLLLISLAVITVTYAASKDCDSPRHFKGCVVQKRQCICSHMQACTNPYPYANMLECRQDIKGLGDKCLPEPCEHGRCVQVKPFLRRKWKCACAGTGFWGRRCQMECP